MLRTTQIDLNRNIYLTVFILISAPLLLLLFSGSGQAKSFPFRTLTIGKPIPDARFAGYGEEEAKTIHSFAGNPLLLVFWGGDLEAKKKRAIKAFTIIQQLMPYLSKKKVSVFVINMQDDSQKVVDAVTTLSGLTVPFYRDDSRRAYSTLGIYVLPAFLFVDANGNVSGGIGYSRDLAERIKGEVDVMLGIISRKQLHAQLNPEIKEMSIEKKRAVNHMKTGIVMNHKGMPETALQELLQALDLDPTLSQARIELGCIYLKKGNLEDAIKELEEGMKGKPDSIQAEICLAQVSAEMGEVDEAIQDLKALLFHSSRNSDLRYAVGVLLQQQGKYEEAAQSFRKSFELLQRKVLLHE